MDRATKKQTIESLNGALKKSKTLVVAHYHGLTVSDVTSLRRSARAAGVKVQVTKNTLARIALRNTQFENAIEYLTGPTALFYSEDAVAAAKISVEFAKTNEKLVILGGSLDMQKLAANDVKDLAAMPSLDELRGKLVGLLQAPATKIACVLQAPAAQLARVFNAYATK